MRIIVLTAISLLFCLISAAQVKSVRVIAPELPVLENSMFECVYSHIEYDADLDRDNCKDEILQLGRNYGCFMPYGTYKSDSVVQSMDKNARNALTFTQLNNNVHVVYGWGGYDWILFDLKGQSLSHVVGRSGGRYEEAMPAQEWEFLEDEATFMGYKCRKARCTFRGCKWTAWYCPEIKLPYGSWKLRGLPGFILAASDSTGVQTYTAIGLRTKPTPIYMSRRHGEVRLMKREDCARVVKDICFTACKPAWERYNEDSVNFPRPALKHLYYVPHELDMNLE